MVKCDHCRKPIANLPHRCRYCGEVHCPNHLLPENHDCPGVKNRESWERVFRGDKKPKKGSFKKRKSKKRKEKYYSNSPNIISKNIATKSEGLDEVVISLSSNRRRKQARNDDDIGRLAISRNRKNSKKNRRSGKKHKVLWITFTIALILVMYTNWDEIAPHFPLYNITEESSIDTQTIEAFGYINAFRSISGSPELIYEEELYEWVKAVAESKQNNPDSYETNGEFLKALEINFDRSGISSSYYKTYFIGGKGVEEFLTQFNKNFNARNIIKDSKYNRGAIYCSLDYCVLFVFSGEIIKKGTIPIETDFTEDKPKKDYLASISNFFSKIFEGAGEVASDVGSGIKETFSGENRDVGAVEQKIYELVNTERSNYNARTLSQRNNLNSFARSWSDKMMSEGFFEHSNLNFAYPNIAGENIGETPVHYDVIGCGATYTNNALAECFVSGWIGSSGHHENMIDKRFSMTGIGVSCDLLTCRATQVFSG